MTGHLIHIGSPKAASHVLRRWFTDHPQLAYEDGGIAGYSNVHEIAREGAAEPRDVLFRVTSSESLSAPSPSVGRAFEAFDASLWNGTPSRQSAVCASLAALFPTAHVLLVTRGFRSMILSAYSQFVRLGADLDFAMYCKLLREKTDAGDGAWHYDQLIRLYAGSFGNDKLIVVPVELLRDDADTFIRVIEARLGLEHTAATNDLLYPSLSGVEMHWYPRLSRTMRLLPTGRLLGQLYLRSAFSNRFRRPIALLQLLSPKRPVTLDLIPEDLVNAFRGKADSLRGNSIYAPYAQDYLF